jgi:hypothetical protein
MAMLLKTIVAVAFLFCALGHAPARGAEATPAPAEQVVYEVPHDTPAGGIGGIYEFGEQITLTGANRTITSFEMTFLTSDPPGTTFDLQLRFYLNDGPFGQPQTLLWTSPRMDDLPASPVLSTLKILVPKVVVPSSFTWTAETTDYTSQVYRAWSYAPPLAGGYETTWRFNDYWITDGERLPQVIKIGAVPEPAGPAMIAAATAGLWTLLGVPRRLANRQVEVLPRPCVSRRPRRF